MAGTISLTSTLNQFIPNYWDTVLGENLYPNLYFYQFGTKRTVPRNFGTSIKIPRLKKQNITYGLTEGTIVATCAVSGQTISGTMNQFGGAYKHSDLLIMTALSDIVELSLIDLARDIARKIDRTIRNALSGSGAILSNTSATFYAAHKLRPTDILEAVVRLDGADNPRPPDNHYPTIIHPYVAYDIQNNVSSGGWLDVTKYTEGNVNRIYLGEIGRLYGARFITSNNIRRKLLSGTVSGVRNYMFAPDSYYVTEISDMTARTFVKQLGSGGTSDPINQVSTVGAKVFFGVVPASWTSAETRVVRLTFATGIAGGDTTT